MSLNLIANDERHSLYPPSLPRTFNTRDWGLGAKGGGVATNVRAADYIQSRTRQEIILCRQEIIQPITSLTSYSVNFSLYSGEKRAYLHSSCRGLAKKQCVLLACMHSWLKSEQDVIRNHLLQQISVQSKRASKSDIKSLSLYTCREIAPVRDFTWNTYVALQWHNWFKFYFPLLLGMVMYDNGRFEAKETKIWTRDKIKPQHIPLQKWKIVYILIHTPLKGIETHVLL